EYDAQGRPEIDDDFLLLLNAHYETVPFTMPPRPEEARWQAVMDTSYSAGLEPHGFFKPGDEYLLKARSMVVLTNARPPERVEEEAE
ncbi:MAG: isoamylase, partial [Rubrobacteraceae bacterium]|nr:isoamylase [Rubrobacteraceae bacterium]